MKVSKLEDSTGLSGILKETTDENIYFVDAKKIRISTKNIESGDIEKQEVIVHVDCLKQLD